MARSFSVLIESKEDSKTSERSDAGEVGTLDGWH